MKGEKKIRVMIVAPFPPPFGGIASFAVNLVSGLSNTDIQCIKYNTMRYEKLRFHNPDRKRNYLRIIDLRNIFFLIINILDFIPFSYSLIKERIDIVHIHTSSFWGWWRSTTYITISRFFCKKTILHIHNAIDRFYGQESNKFEQYLIRSSLKIPHRIITLSHGIKEFVSQLTSTPISVIYNGVDLEKFSNKKDYSKTIKILFAGFVGSQKGVSDLLQAFNKARMKEKRFLLTIMGNGDIEEMKSFTSKLNLNQFVEFTGRVNEEIKMKLFNSHHILALPSYGEGQPISILEGMASGMSILSTKVGSIPEIVEDSVNGFLLEPGDIKGLAENILRLNNIKLLKSINKINREKVKLKFEFENVIQNNIKLYNEIMVNN